MNENLSTGNPGKVSAVEGKSITMAMIAKAAGVSQGAISSLLNDRDYGIRVSPKTRERVFRVCRELGYVPNDLRAVVRMYPERGDLALLVAAPTAPAAPSLAEAALPAPVVPPAPRPAAEPSIPLSPELISGLIARTGTRHLCLAAYDPSLDYAAPGTPLPPPVATGIASRFITAGEPCRSLLSAILAREYPVVHLGQETGVPGTTSIVPDYAQASRLAIETLLSLGHRQIAILSGPFGFTDPVVIGLNQGIRAAYDATRTPIEAQNILYGDDTLEHGIASADLLLSRPQPPTAVFCFSPLVAAGVLQRAQERGLKLPEALSVIAFGDEPFAPLLHPPLTTVGIDQGELLAHTAGDLQKRLKEEDLASTRKILLPGRLIERGSCSRRE